MFMQEEGIHYNIKFGHSPKKVPNYIEVAFPELFASFQLDDMDFLRIIPALATVKSPLIVHDALHEAIKQITYDKVSGSLIIEPKESIETIEDGKKVRKEISMDGWIYVPGDGFYEKERHDILDTLKLTSDQIAEALNDHYPMIKDLLIGTVVHDDPVVASYKLSFDEEWNLHITCYLFEPGDLIQPYSRRFGDWVYLDEKGFYRVEGLRFDEVDSIVPCRDVPDFLSNNRSWFNTQEGFRIHLAPLEAQMTYTLSPDNRLSFSRKIAVKDEGALTKDFGPWVYISGQGFYSKVTSHIGLPVRPGIELKADQIPSFIRANREELHLVPGFFSEKCPVVRSGLHIELTENESISIYPEYELLTEYKDTPIRYFDDIVYIEGEGFHELPVDARLPERLRYPILIESENAAMFLTYEFESVKEYASELDPRLIKPSSLILISNTIFKDEKHGKGWYGLKLAYQTEKGFIPVSTIWTAIKAKKRFLFSDAGLIDLHERRFNWLKLLRKNRIDRRSNTLFLSTLELIRLNAFDEIVVRKAKGSDYEESVRLLKELTQFQIPEEPDISGLISHLRPYQEMGLRWLWFLYHHNLSGMLCDDMGLGKTHQAMALLAAILNARKKANDTRPVHFLIVCPTSVIYHWQEKLQAFLPGARVCTFYGTKRSLESFHQQYDILLTSYGICRIEYEVLSKLQFEVAIFDEIQIAKNYTSLVHASLLTVHANMRLGLTGTPIENRLRELKSLFDIVLPTYMPSEADYKEFFIKPIEKESNEERRGLLSRFIRPFVLRRRKDDVLLDLPEKIEEVAHCELLPDQQKLYMDILNRAKNRLMQDLESDKTPIPYIHIFALLAHLKQICDHPAVYLKEPLNYKKYQSGKWELFVELLSEARESRQKVVVFSQYLAMMDIIEEYLIEEGIGYASIRGSTIDRGGQVQKFNKVSECEVFIGSLQAAGLGIDLTAASVVIHYDRWWNAARENQATDRVHRIGQTRGVQVFKLVSKGTFEEKIDILISKKGKLMEDVVGFDDHENP